jgi:hypothetical protein
LRPESSNTRDCEPIQEKLLFFLDGDLAAREREEVEAHLARCKHCSRELDELRGLDAGFAKVFPSDPRELSGGDPACLDGALRERFLAVSRSFDSAQRPSLSRVSRPGIRLRRWVLAGAAAAAAVLLAFAGWWSGWLPWGQDDSKGSDSEVAVAPWQPVLKTMRLLGSVLRGPEATGESRFRPGERVQLSFELAGRGTVCVAVLEEDPAPGLGFQLFVARNKGEELDGENVFTFALPDEPGRVSFILLVSRTRRTPQEFERIVESTSAFLSSTPQDRGRLLAAALEKLRAFDQLEVEVETVEVGGE